MSSATTSIPLHCLCCAKKPKFSDVSHLLTHVQSKGHLSQYYKLKIKAGSDPESRHVIDQFDQWYSDYDVENMMQDRMSIKDKKRARPRTSATSRAASRATSTLQRTSTRNSRTNRNINNNYLGSSAHGHNIKQESRGSPFDSTAMFTAPLPQYGNHWLSSRPQALRSQSSVQEWADHASESSALTSLASTEPSTVSDDVVFGMVIADHPDQHAVADNCKLKGEYGTLPGMGIFDSATPQERRRRNQKKDPSVIKQLQHNSTLIDDTEFVWTSDGNFQRELKITGIPEEDAEVSSPVRRSPRKSVRVRTPTRSSTIRNILMEIENNGQHRQVDQGRDRTRSMSDLTEADDRLELQLNYGAGQKRKRLGIYRDDDQEVRFDRPVVHESTVSNPAPMQWLTAPFHPSSSTPPAFNINSTHHDNEQPVKMFNASSQILYQTEKENFQMMHPATFPPGLYNAGLPIGQYHHQRQVSVSNLNPSLFSPQHSYFMQPDQPMDTLSPLKLSPLKLDRRNSDDDCTITAPNSEV